MATITPTKITNVGNELAFAASATGGDAVTYLGGTLVVEFDNGHNASITVNFAPTTTSVVAPGVGTVTVPTRSTALAAGEVAVFVFKPGDVEAYLDANGRVPITYTSGNTALVVRAFYIV